MEPMTTPQHILTRVHQYNKYDNHPTISPRRNNGGGTLSLDNSTLWASIYLNRHRCYITAGVCCPMAINIPHHSTAAHLYMGPPGTTTRISPEKQRWWVTLLTYSRRLKQEADEPISVFKTASMARMPINGRRAGTYLGRRSMDTSRQHKHPCHRVCVYEPMDVLHVYACKGTSLGHRGSEAVLRREHNRQARI